MRRHVVIFIIGMAVCALFVGLITAIFVSATKSTEIRDDQLTNTPLIENTDATLRLIRNCTTPGRACYERGQDQLARAVGDINRVVVLAAACASGPYQLSQAEIQRCVVDALADSKR